MPVTSFKIFFIGALFILPLIIREPITPLVPNTAVASASTTVATNTNSKKHSAPSTPLRVRVPKIGLNSPIQNMGLTSSGDLDVPDGSTKKIGWYAAGTKPGEVGSAVFDAHVFAAFKQLRYALPGTDVYVDMSNGETLHFKIEESTVYPLANVPADQLFNRDDKPRLNLITCAGNLTADRTTYDHRLIAYAVLVE